jgi:micrococcal nuclease
VRLVATNAPDRGECFADEALDHLITTLEGASVELHVTGVDQFDRTLAYVLDGDRNVNLEMVSDGFSLASTPDEEDPNRVSILDAEDIAFTSGSGLWAPDACGATRDLPAARFEPESSEVDPAGDDNDDLTGEFVTIVNEGDDTLSLAGWILRDESTRHRYRFGTGVELGPGESLRVPSDAAGWDPGGSPVWNNGGDMALLQLPDGTVIDRWRY